jgi:ribosome maturation factor RimP
VGRRPAFFIASDRDAEEEIGLEAPHQDIEEKIAALDPAIELIAVERFGPEGLRVYVDHPDGVDLGLCERVTKQLGDLTSDWALEVSSPGLDRPLTKPAHYERFLGSRVRVRTGEQLGGRRNFTGVLVSAGADSISVEDEAGVHEIPLSAVHRSNLVPEFSEVNQ